MIVAILSKSLDSDPFRRSFFRSGRGLVMYGYKPGLINYLPDGVTIENMDPILRPVILPLELFDSLFLDVTLVSLFACHILGFVHPTEGIVTNCAHHEITRVLSEGYENTSELPKINSYIVLERVQSP